MQLSARETREKTRILGVEFKGVSFWTKNDHFSFKDEKTGRLGPRSLGRSSCLQRFTAPALV